MRRGNLSFVFVIEIFFSFDILAIYIYKYRAIRQSCVPKVEGLMIWDLNQDYEVAELCFLRGF